MSERANLNEIPLPGCTPAPLSAYLKALGILRLVAEQKDSDARGFWRDETFVLMTTLSGHELVGFFLNEYAPTPIVSPWNGGSGFFPKDAKDAFGAVATSQSARLAQYRQAIEVATDVLKDLGIGEKPEKDAKPALLAALRARLPDQSLGWFDASVVLASDRLDFPPLLGTGGNDGRLEFSNNHMQRLVSLIDVSTGEPTDIARAHISVALFGVSGHGLDSGAVGQFSPGAAGGANASTGFGGDPLLTAWDFVLMLEGTLLFAAATARRLEARDLAVLVAPFTVRSSGSGSGAADITDEDDARAEFWAPLWKQPAALLDLEALLHEGRAAVARRQARDGLDFIRAAAHLGVARGVEAFERFGFLMRSGRTYFATPLGRAKVERNVNADLIDELDRGAWLGLFRQFARGANAPARLRVAARKLEDTLFDLTQNRDDPLPIQSTLLALGAVAVQLSASEARKNDSERLRPPPPLSPAWIERADDGSPEFRIAVALASVGAWPQGVRETEKELPERGHLRDRLWLPMAAHIAPLDENLLNPERGRRRFVFASSSALHVWGPGDLSRNLASIAERRLIEAKRRGLDDKSFAGHPSVRADLADVLAFLDGAINDVRIAELIRGLVWVDFGMLRGFGERRGWQIALRSREPAIQSPLPLAYAVLKPLFVPNRDLRSELWNPKTGELFVPLAEGASLSVPPNLLRLLMTRRTTRDAVTSALRRCRSSGLVCPFADSMIAAPLDGRRLAASLLIPITNHSLATVVARAFVADEGDADAA
jgi:CRISPR-associated protein Csx17